MVGGITEPIEFLFLFVSPMLFLCYAMMMAILGVKISNTDGNLLDFVIFDLLRGRESGWWWVLMVDPIWLAIYYSVFHIVIKRQNPYSCVAFIDLYSTEGDSVIVQTPCYDAFINLIEGRGRKLLANPLHYDGTHYSLDMTDLAEKMAHAKILLLCNPHNPTGLVFTEEQLTDIIALAQQHNIAVISDKAHMDLVFKRAIHVPINKVWSDYAKVVLATSTAKGFNLTSLGGSYAFINDVPMHKKFVNNLRRDGLSSPPILAITGTIAAYTHGLNWLNAVTDYIHANLKYMEQFFAQNLPQVRLHRAEATYFAWINVSGLNLNYEQIQEKLIANGLAIMSGSTYGQHEPQFLRMNIACPRSKVDTALKAMKIAFNMS
jgi:cystathionine beta-lyase